MDAMVRAERFAALRGRRVLVTGSTGFKGGWLCAWLLELGAKVSGFALSPEPEAPLFGQLRLGERIDQHFGDIRDAATVSGVFDAVRPEVCIHLAVQALVRRSYAEPKRTFDTNIGGGVNLLEAVRTAPDLRALVFATSDKCYRNKEWVWGYRENDELGGPDPYSGSKAAAELVFGAYQESFLTQREKLGAATVRAGNVIGGGDWSADRIVPDAIRSLVAGRPIRVRNPAATRPWQHVLEPLAGYLTTAVALLEAPNRFAGAWNFGPDMVNVRTVREVAEHAVRTWGDGSVEVDRETDAPHEAQLLYLDNAKAGVFLGWRPVWGFEDAVSRAVGWYRQVHDGADPVEVTREQIRAFLEAGAEAHA